MPDRDQTYHFEIPVNAMLWRSGIDVRIGDRLAIETHSNGLRDSFVPLTTAAGMATSELPSRMMRPILWPLQGLRQRPDADWLTLIGGIVEAGEEPDIKTIRSERFFVVGCGTTITASHSGVLAFFVNDVRSQDAYDNNRGQVFVSMHLYRQSVRAAVAA